LRERERARGRNLIHKRSIHEIGSPDAEVQHIDPAVYSIIEGIEEPGGVGQLVSSEHSEDVERGIWSEPCTLPVGGCTDRRGEEERRRGEEGRERMLGYRQQQERGPIINVPVCSEDR